MICPSCSAENREGARFCDACGASQEPGRTSGSRRTVTILFSDITGSTELGERLDPERLRHVLSRYFDAMRTVIERHGGTVEKFIGDAVMAVFGIPRVHEDDALRAVRATSDMADALDEINDELESANGVRIRTRTGVNTGEVVVDDGDGDGGESLVTGDAVNVAARFEQAASPGEVLIGEETFRLVRDAILAEPVEPLSLKGKSEPVVAYRLTKVDPSAAGFARRLDAPMVGRDRELSLLRGAFERALSDHVCQLFTVLGVGGVGKSRLLAAFVDEMGDRATVLRGRCLPYGDGITFWPIVEAVGQAVGLSEMDDPEGSITRIAALIPDDEHAERIARQISQVVGVSDANVAPEETLWAIRRLLEGMARAHPVVFMIDDIQWAEPTMLELIEYVAEWSVDSPILLACMARPELLEVKPGWGGGKLNATSISLQPLSTSECETLIANLLAIERVDPAVRERVAAAAEGHPLFAEEMLAMLVEEGRITRREGEWVASSDLSELAVPPTTSALLAARIDHLGAGERATLERASVMGQIFYREALVHLSGADDVGPGLASLARKQFVRPEKSDMPDVEALAFRHLLIRDAAYEGITKAERAELHERFADWLESRAPEQQELLGHHLEQAHGYLTELGANADRTGAIAERAASRLSGAGKRAFDRGDVSAAASLLERATSLMRGDDPARVDVSISAGLAARDAGQRARSNALFHQAVAAAEQVGVPSLLGRARLLALWNASDPMMPGWHGKLERSARSLLDVAGSEDDDQGLAWAWQAIGDLAWMRCRSDEAQPAWERAVAHFERAGDGRSASECRGWLSAIPLLGPMPCNEALPVLHGMLAEVRGSPGAESEIGDSIAWVRVMMGQVDEGRSIMSEHAQLFRELGRRETAAFEAQALGWLELTAGNAADAERHLGEAVRELVDMGSPLSGIILSIQAQALYKLGRYDEAGEAARRVPGLQGDVSTHSLALGVEAMILARDGMFDDAERMAREVVRRLDESDWPSDRGDSRMMLTEVLQLAGRAAEAAEVVREAIALYEGKGNVLQAGTARAKLVELTG